MSAEPEKLAEGTLISHLLELRDRLIKALMGVGLIFVPCMMYANDIFSYVSQPLQEKLPKGASLIATSVMSPFTTPFKLSFFIAAFIAMPWILYQLWAFVAPGLYRHENEPDAHQRLDEPVTQLQQVRDQRAFGELFGFGAHEWP